MRHWSVLPFLLLLPACWASKGNLYAANPKAPAPFGSGRYAPIGKPGDYVQMLRLADGRFKVSQPGKPDQVSPVSFHPLTVPGRKVWVMQVPFEAPVNASVYELVETRADGTVLMAELECGGSEAITKAAGGSITSDKNFNNGRPSCIFTSRASLEKAAMAFVKAHPQLPGAQAVKRVSD
jgi:hypothetical protein